MMMMRAWIWFQTMDEGVTEVKSFHFAPLTSCLGVQVLIFSARLVYTLYTFKFLEVSQ